MLDQTDEPLQVKCQCFSLAKVSNRVPIHAQVKFAAHESSARLIDGTLPPPQPYRVFQKSLCAELFAGSFRGTRLACDTHWIVKPTTVQVDP